jgi:hypothetical protein
MMHSCTVPADREHGHSHGIPLHNCSNAGVLTATVMYLDYSPGTCRMFCLQGTAATTIPYHRTALRHRVLARTA